METYEIYHHGIKGMRWGIRRTKAQLGYKTSPAKRTSIKTMQMRKKNAPKKASPDTSARKSISEMSDDELRAKLNRLRLEKELRDLTPKQVSTGRKIINSIVNDVLVPSTKDAGKKIVSSVLETQGKKLISKLLDTPNAGNSGR